MTVFDFLNRALKFCYPRMARQAYAAKYVSDGVISQHDMSVLGEPPLERNAFRHYLCLTLARKCASLHGVFISIGVNRGEVAMKVLTTVRPRNRWYLVDPWDARRSSTDPTPKPGYVEGMAFARERFAPYPNVMLIRGTAPDALHKLPHEPIAWAHFNTGDAPAEIASLELLGPRLQPGGVIVIDIFGRKSASDEDRAGFMAAAAAAGLTALVLPTGHLLAMR